MKTRWFKLRSKHEIDDQMSAWLRRGFDEWRSYIYDQIATWLDHEVARCTPVPQYDIADLVRSADRKEVSVEINGDPGSVLAFKTVEDGVPPMIWAYVPHDRRCNLEKRYVSQEYDYGDWLPVR